jgi:hypothetical protein
MPDISQEVVTEETKGLHTKASLQAMDGEFEIALRAQQGPIGQELIKAENFRMVPLMNEPKGKVPTLRGMSIPGDFNLDNPQHADRQKRALGPHKEMGTLAPEFNLSPTDTGDFSSFVMGAHNANPFVQRHELGHIISNSASADEQIQDTRFNDETKNRLFDAFRARTSDQWTEAVRGWNSEVSWMIERGIIADTSGGPDPESWFKMVEQNLIDTLGEVGGGGYADKFLMKEVAARNKHEDSSQVNDFTVEQRKDYLQRVHKQKRTNASK